MQEQKNRQLKDSYFVIQMRYPFSYSLILKICFIAVCINFTMLPMLRSYGMVWLGVLYCINVGIFITNYFRSSNTIISNEPERAKKRLSSRFNQKIWVTIFFYGTLLVLFLCYFLSFSTKDFLIAFIQIELYFIIAYILCDNFDIFIN